jgi:serine/threonine protein kinase
MMNLMKHDRIVEFIGKPKLLSSLDLEVETFSIIMELMPLGTLRHIIQTKSLNKWTTKKQIMTDICEAGAFLHSSFYSNCTPKKVVLHQDLKSPNVLISMENGVMRAKIADFGLAFLKEFTSDMSKSKSVQHNGGTVVYQAPELFEVGAKFTKVHLNLTIVEM